MSVTLAHTQLFSSSTESLKAFSDGAFKQQSNLGRKIEITRTTVSLDAGHMHRRSRGFAVDLLAKSIFVAHLMEKDELLITQVMPWINEFCSREVSPMEAEPWFNSIVEDACGLLECEVPVMRLSSRSGELELRCYMNEEKPTDYYYLEDWYCEARENFLPS